MDFILIRNKKIYPYIVIVIIIFLFEILVGNFSSIKTVLCKPTILAQNVETDENGNYQTEIIPVNQNVKNVYVDLELQESECAKVVVSLTDAGDAYSYNLPEITVVPGVKSTYYTNIYPYGRVNQMQVRVTVPEWSNSTIHFIAVNVSKPFGFKWMRFVVLSLMVMFFYYIKNEKAVIHQVYCKRGNSKQLLLIAIAVFLILIFVGFLVRVNPAFVKLPWPHQHQYQELARAFKDGDVSLPYEPSKELLQATNPYDTIALMVDNIEYRMDYAYYQGKYYVYFGIIPELLLFLPYHTLTSMDLPNYVAMYILCAGFVIGVFGLLWEIVHRFAKKVPFLHYLLMCLSVCFFSSYVLMMVRPDIYNIPIMAGTCFTMWGLFFWLRGLQFIKKRIIYIFLGSLCMAMVAGCRPQMLLYQVVVIPLFYSFIVNERSMFSKKSWKETICFCLPYLLIGLLVFWYNDARFGSGFDFGATYSLTSNDMNHRGFNLSRVFQGLFSFFIQPPVINGVFPFLFSTELATNYMGKNMTEFTFGGIYTTNLILTGAFLVFFKIKKKITSQIRAILQCLSISSLTIAIFDVNGAGILQRYMGDMVLGLLLAAVLIWVLLLDNNEKNSHYIVLSNIFCILVATGLLYSFLIIFAKGDSSCLQNSNPSLFFRATSYFKF